MTTTIYVPDIECDSCQKLINKKLQGQSDKISFHEDRIEVENPKTSTQNIIHQIKELGFRASTDPFERMTFKERWRHFKENKQQYKLETKGIRYSIYIFIILSLIQVGAYEFFLKQIPNFLTNYGWWLFYLNVSIASVAVGMWHIAAYKAKVTCMVGMMIGMTIGMQSGMMIGAVIGATNGFFVGAMVGMFLGVTVGLITGKCCGVMGVMEGMMAGLMGGTMGPMISVMMFSDNLLIFMPFYMIINIIIMGGLSYMMYEEVVEHKQGVLRKPMDFASLASLSIILGVILMIIMIYGPKSPLVAF